MGPHSRLDLRQFQHKQEQQLLEQSLRMAKYNQKGAAELLGLTYHQLRALLKSTRCADGQSHSDGFIPARIPGG